MTDDELGFESYVVLGNALHLLVNGVAAKDQQRLNLPMDDLRRLHAFFEPVRANETLDALARLPQTDRNLLAASLRLCSKLADTQAEHLLGAPADIVRVVEAHLQAAEADPHAAKAHSPAAETQLQATESHPQADKSHPQADARPTSGEPA